jgi:N-acetylglutamate synthase/N-acetylornithine aminotransferase
MVLHRVATTEEHDDLLLEVLLEECKEEHEPLIRVADDITLLEHVDGGGLLLVIDVDVEGSRTERDAGEVGDFGGLRGGEEHGLAVL